MRFKEIPQFPRAYYSTHVDWRVLEDWLQHQMNERSFAQLDLEPDFQRVHCWTDDQKTRYIEYILSGGESGRDLFFNCKGWQRTYEGPFVIVDGKQRLEAVRGFLADRVKAFGHYYSDFTDRLPPDVNFRIHIANLDTRAEVLQWYIDFNRGGVAHTDAEIERVRELLQKELDK